MGGMKKGRRREERRTGIVVIPSASFMHGNAIFSVKVCLHIVAVVNKVDWG